jgi:hypothetical protein
MRIIIGSAIRRLGAATHDPFKRLVTHRDIKSGESNRDDQVASLFQVWTIASVSSGIWRRWRFYRFLLYTFFANTFYPMSAFSGVTQCRARSYTLAATPQWAIPGYRGFRTETYATLTVRLALERMSSFTWRARVSSEGEEAKLSAHDRGFTARATQPGWR